ncbi:hypothetical protein THAOC_01721, partial [Thalassiosira oceanica]
GAVGVAGLPAAEVREAGQVRGALLDPRGVAVRLAVAEDVGREGGGGRERRCRRGREGEAPAHDRDAREAGRRSPTTIPVSKTSLLAWPPSLARSKSFALLLHLSGRGVGRAKGGGGVYHRTGLGWTAIPNPFVNLSALCVAVANWNAGSVGSARRRRGFTAAEHRSIVQQYKTAANHYNMDGPTEPGDRGDSSVVDRLNPLSPRAEAQHGGPPLPTITRATRTVDISRTDQDLVAGIASFLGSGDLVNVGLTCRRLGTRSEGQQLSLVDRAAKVAFETSATDEERTRLPKYDDESHLSLLSRLEQARRPLEFDRFVSVGWRHSPGGRSGILCRSKGKYETAASTCIMRAGRHYAAFTLVSAAVPTARVGVMRPIRARHLESFDPVGPEACDLIRSERSSRWSGNVHACQHECFTGTCVWNDGERKRSDDGWVGIVGTGVDRACEVGLLLDLDKGTITVYNDNRRCGIMKSGLAGEYCFCVTQCSRLGLKGDMVIIRRGNPNTKKGN